MNARYLYGTVPCLLALFPILSHASTAVEAVASYYTGFRSAEDRQLVEGPPFVAEANFLINDRDFCGACTTDSHARASLVDGTIRISSHVTTIISPVSGNPIYRPAVAFARINDEIRFVSPNAPSGTVLRVPFTVSFDGAFIDGIDSNAEFSASLQDTNANLNVEHPNWFVLVGVSSLSSDPSSNRIVSADGLFSDVQFNSQNRVVQTSFSGLVDVVLNQPANPLNIQLTINGSGSFDFSHTGAIRFGSLPEDVTFTSSSGVFLSAVPIGSPFGLMLSGLSAVSALGFRRKAGIKKALV